MCYSKLHLKKREQFCEKIKEQKGKFEFLNQSNLKNNKEIIPKFKGYDFVLFTKLKNIAKRKIDKNGIVQNVL